MDINFPLILVILVFVTGVIALFDWLVLARPRRKALAEVDRQFAGTDPADSKQQGAYERARAIAAQEPVAVEYAKSFFPVLAIVLVLRSFIVEPFQIPSESMVPTLEIGDFILVNKFTYGIRLPVIRTKVLDVSDPERGDVMVFFPPGESRYFIKRVVGLPGDKISIFNNELTINGEVVEQKLVDREAATNRSEFCYRAGGSYLVEDEQLGESNHRVRKCTEPGSLSREGFWIVPEGHYFMMGDNRDNSSDSRDWGSVPEERIVGKAFAIWMHWEELFSLPSFDRVGRIR
ncbi:signal peptidase I [Gilvimarinus sp. F26214L]|uniref:signal peptidase I n=1 Tax=Gilvimarinus sp. DZF01 TaxID=3461371 RepID=UPI00404609FB